MILQNSQYVIKALSIFSAGATPGDNITDKTTNNTNEFGIDIRGLFQELNIFENIFFPCVTGKVLIHDGIGLNRKIRFDGSEYIYIHITKQTQDDQNSDLEIKGFYLIHKVTDRTSIGMNSEAYVLHFISHEFLLSEQTKIRKAYQGKYSDIITTILRNELNVRVGEVVGGKIQATVEQTKNGNKVIIPNLTPFKAIEFLTTRSLNIHGVPDFLFWQNHLFGYTFVSLSTIFSRDHDFEVNFSAKNMTLNYLSDNTSYYDTSMLAVNEFKILNNFDLIRNVKNGYYAGKFLGFDPLTRVFEIKEIKHMDVWGKVPPGQSNGGGSDSGSHANRFPFNTTVYNKRGISAEDMYESKITLYPFESDRKTNSYVSSKDPTAVSDIDMTDDYILQRRSIFHNLMQRVLRITMPGNFRFLSGKNILLNMPHFYNERDIDDEELDKSLSGKYLITAVRHIIKSDKHETILEIATDSSQIDPLRGV